MKLLQRLWSKRRLSRAFRAAEHAELRQPVAAAVQRLRELGLARSSRWQHAAAAPWYALVGEAGSGKSSALRALGFEPLRAMDGDEPPVGLLAGWCSGGAVCWELSAELLEPGAGRPGVGDAAGELARWQPHLPLEGVLLTLSVEHLLAGSDAGRQRWLQHSRQCLELLQRRLQRELPVYLLLTRVDQLPGFAPFWTRVDSEQCQAPWGASWQERSPEGGSFGARVAAEWALLRRALHARALQVIGRAGAEDAAALFELTESFAALGERLSRQVHQLTEIHPCRPRLWLRGFYLCTAEPPCQHSQRTGWFFQQLFERAILSDRESVSLPARWRERERMRQRWQWGALLGAGALACVPALLSREANLELMETTEQALRGSEPRPEAPDTRSEQGAELEPLLAQLERLESAAQSWSVRHWWGPYAAGELGQRLARRYGERLEAMIRGPIRDQLQAELRAVGDVVRFDWHNFRHAADTLKLHLMLTQPARLDPDWAAGRLLHSWQRARERGACGGSGPLEPHIERWLSALQADARLALPGDDALVSRIRSRLSSLPVPELGLAWLAEAARTVPPVRATQVFDANAARSWNVPLDALVPGTYTRSGWELLRPALPSAVFPAADAWIFGRALPASWSSEGVQRLHLRRHADAWRALFLELSAAARASRAHQAEGAWGRHDALARIQIAAQPDAPLARLFQVLAQNVRFPLAEPGAAVAQQVAAELKERLGAAAAPAVSPLEQELAGVLAFAFAEEQGEGISPSSALAEYQKELRALAASLQSPNTADMASRERESAALQRVAATVGRLLGTLNGADRELLEGLLLAPIEDGLAQHRAGEQRRLAELWWQQVAQPLGHLRGRFPFQLSASEDAEWSELQALLEPREGALWRFVEGELTQRVRESATGFELMRPASGEAPLSPELLPCLSAARELRQLLFAADGAEALAVRLSSSGGSTAALSLTVDGQTLEVPGSAGGESGWLSFTWPGTAGPAGAAVQLRTGPFADEIRRMGSFGWLRLLLEGGVRASGQAGEQRLWQASWALQHGQTRVLLELRARASRRAPGLDLFPSLACPAQLFGSRPGAPS